MRCRSARSKEREALLVAAARKASRYFRSVICLRSTQHKVAQPNRHYLCHAEPLRATPKCYFFRAGGFPEVPATVPPVCILFADAFQRLLTAHRKPGLCKVCLPAISTFQRHSTQHLLHYWPPSSFHLVPVCRQLQRAYYLDFARVRAPRGVPSGCVQRTGCSACGLGYPHQVLVGSPHVHSSLLVPVSLSGFLIKCLRVHWHSLPHCRFAWLFLAPCGLLLPKKY